jgi:hypothetical protein
MIDLNRGQTVYRCAGEWGGEVGRLCGLGSNLFNFFTQLKFEGRIFFYTVGKQPF